jgi:hypothetical protein
MLSNGFVLFWFVIGGLVIGLGMIRMTASLSIREVPPGEDDPGPAETRDPDKTGSDGDGLSNVFV